MEMNKSLDAFFQSNNKVLIIKGDWGVGKTYYWNDYFNKNKSKLSQVAYSYVSLFGKNSLGELKKEVFHLAKPIKQSKEISAIFRGRIEESDSIYFYMPWFGQKEKTIQKIPFLKKIVKYADNIPMLSRTAGMMSSFEYSLINNYVVCFDDLERKGNSLSIKEIMGFIDELAQSKNCKVVLIFNEETLSSDDDKATFKAYREKVVDLEVKFSPTVEQNFNCIFYPSSQDYEQLLEIIKKLKVKNIRFLKKVKELIYSYDSILKSADDDVRREFVLHACVLCYGYYLSSEVLPYEELKNRLLLGSLFSSYPGDEKEETEGEKAYNKLTSELLIQSSYFDEEIDFFLKNGYCNPDSNMEFFVSKKNRDEARKRMTQSIYDISRLYRASFKDNEDEFVRKILSILNSDLSKVDLPQFDILVSFLGDFDINVNEYIEKYVSITSFNSKTYGDDMRLNVYLRDLRNEYLKLKVVEKVKNNRCMSLSNVAAKLASGNGWNPEDVNYLTALSVNDFVDWMKSGDSVDVIGDVNHGLLKFRNMTSSDPRYAKITDNVIDALKIIANGSKINYLRVKSFFNIDINIPDNKG